MDQANLRRALRVMMGIALVVSAGGAQFASTVCPDCGTITGTVVDSSGAVVAGAHVTLDVVPGTRDSTLLAADSVVRDGDVTRFWAVEGKAPRLLGVATQTSASGTFWVDALPEGIYTLRASHLGQESDGEPVVALAGATTLRVVRLKPVRGGSTH